MNELREIALDLIDRNPDQPRTVFDEVTLAELAESIKMRFLWEGNKRHNPPRPAVKPGDRAAVFCRRNRAQRILACLADFLRFKSLSHRRQRPAGGNGEIGENHEISNE